MRTANSSEEEDYEDSKLIRREEDDEDSKLIKERENGQSCSSNGGEQDDDTLE